MTHVMFFYAFCDGAVYSGLCFVWPLTMSQRHIGVAEHVCCMDSKDVTSDFSCVMMPIAAVEHCTRGYAKA